MRRVDVLVIRGVAAHAGQKLAQVGELLAQEGRWSGRRGHPKRSRRHSLLIRTAILCLA